MPVRKPAAPVLRSLAPARLEVRRAPFPVPEIVSDWMTTAEAAAYLKVKPRTLLKWVREGSVKAYPLHGTVRHVWRFHREELDLGLDLRKPVVSSMVELPASSVARTREGGTQ